VRGNPLQDQEHAQRPARDGRGQISDATKLLESVKGKMGPATAADDDWWQGNNRFSSGRGNGAGRGGGLH
jgi:hypothetical protein